MKNFYTGKIDLWEDQDLPFDKRFSFNNSFYISDLFKAFIRLYPQVLEFYGGIDKEARFIIKFKGWLRIWTKYHEDFKKVSIVKDTAKKGGRHIITFRENIKHPLKDGIFYRFCQDLCTIGKKLSKDQFNSLCWLIGYMISPVIDRNYKAVILSDNGKNYCSGKGLLMKGISHYMNDKDDKTAVTIHNLNMIDRFKYQDLCPQTKIVHVDDVKSDFDFESLYCDLDNELTVNKKGIERFKIKPKFSISMKDVLPLKGESFKARTIVFYLSNYYGPHYSPFQKYGLFFERWDKNEWGRLDVFMNFCKELYQENKFNNPFNQV